jgi:hypothetical protein
MNSETIKHKISIEVREAFDQADVPKYDFTAEDAIATLFKVLHHKTGDSDLDLVGDNIISGLKKYLLENDIGNLPDRCEPFAKFVFRIVDEQSYQDMIRDRDQKETFGHVLKKLKLATNTTLGTQNIDILRGKPFFAEHIGRLYEARNKVHKAPEYSQKTKGEIFQSICVFLVFTVSQYRREIEASLSNIDRIGQLKTLRDRFRKWVPRYVEVEGLERISEGFDGLDPFAVEVLWDDATVKQDRLNEDLEDEGDAFGEENPYRQKIKGRVIDLVEQIPHIVFLGDPGAGKTTTLQYLACHTANRIIEKPSTPLPYPVYVELKFCSRNRSLDQLLASGAGCKTMDSHALAGGAHMLLLDGLNEVPEDYRKAVENDIQYLLDHNKHVQIVITTRPGAYHNQFVCPAFIIQPLTDEQIDSFIGKRFPDLQKKDFIAILKKQPKLWQWGRNPLCLKMLTDVGIQAGGKIPDNKGRLMQLFIHRLMSREKTQNEGMHTDDTIKEHLLSYLAFETRLNGRTAFAYHDGIAILKKAAGCLGSMIDVAQFIREVIDNNLLTKTSDNMLSFSHEMYQEYFAACEIIVRQAINSAFRDTLTDKIWDEPKILYSGLIVDREEFINSLRKKRPHLAAKCYTSSTKDEPSIRTNIEEAAAEAAQNTGSSVVMKENLQALIEVGAVDRFANIIKSAKTFSKEYRQIIEEFVATISPEEALMFIEIIEISGPSRIAVRWIVDALMNKSFQPYETKRALQIAKDFLSHEWTYEAGVLHKLFIIHDTLIMTVDMLLKKRSLIGLNLAIDLIKQKDLEDKFPRWVVQDELLKEIKNLINIRKGVRKAKLHLAIDLLNSMDLRTLFR